MLFNLHKLAVRWLLSNTELLSPLSVSISHVVLWIFVTFHSMQFSLIPHAVIFMEKNRNEVNWFFNL